jgi:hypothetical protein
VVRRLVVLAAVVLGLATAAAAPGQDVLRAETEDWILTAPQALASQADLNLVARSIQLCHDEIVLLTGHRPPVPAKFTMTWVVDGTRGSGATPSGVVNHVPSTAFRIIEDVTRPLWQDRAARGVCFGPHEVTHVLTFPSGMPAWAFEGFATFTDYLYISSRWRCCATPPPLDFSCYESGYNDGSLRATYVDLSPFQPDISSYRTAACAWITVYRLGGLPASRGILAGLRERPATSTAALVAHHLNRVLNADLRPVVALYGFEPSELAAGPTPRIAVCTRIGTAAGETIWGTPGRDTICGLGGNDRLVGGGGSDVLQGGAGLDTLNARDGRRDVVRGGGGRDRARIDRGLDRVVGVETILR